jgi:hypothetical protein
VPSFYGGTTSSGQQYGVSYTHNYPEPLFINGVFRTGSVSINGSSQPLTQTIFSSGSGLQVTGSRVAGNGASPSVGRVVTGVLYADDMQNTAPSTEIEVSGLTWNTGCCYPTWGQIEVIYTQGNFAGKQVIADFGSNGGASFQPFSPQCGYANITANDGNTGTVTFEACE